MAMTVRELKERWTRCYKAIDRELRQRERRYPVGDPERKGELDEVAQLMRDMTVIKNELKVRLEYEESVDAEPTQPRLLDVPQRVKYG